MASLPHRDAAGTSRWSPSTSRRAGEHAVPGGRRRVHRGAGAPRQGRGGEGRRLHLRQEDFVVGADVKLARLAPERAEGERAAREGAARVRPARRSSPSPSSPPSTAPASAAGSSWRWPATAASPPTRPKPSSASPRCSSGLLPGAGGTQRLRGSSASRPRSTSSSPARPSGPRRRASSAWSTRWCPGHPARRGRCERARAPGRGGRDSRARPHRSPRRDRDPTPRSRRTPSGARVLFPKARKQLLKKTRGHYPAPERASSRARGPGEGLEAGPRRGQGLRRAGGHRGQRAAPRDLLRHHRAEEGHRRRRRGEGAAGAEGRRARRRPHGRRHRLRHREQAGLAGAHQGRDDASVGRALAHVRGLLDERVASRRLDRRGLEKCSRWSPATTDSRASTADLVIEAVFEDLALKPRSSRGRGGHGRGVHLRLQHLLDPHHPARRGREAPGNVIGMHYFSPVHKMPLLEVITHGARDPSVVATCVELGKKQGKTVIVVNDGPASTPRASSPRT